MLQACLHFLENQYLSSLGFIRMKEPMVGKKPILSANWGSVGRFSSETQLNSVNSRVVDTRRKLDFVSNVLGIYNRLEFLHHVELRERRHTAAHLIQNAAEGPNVACPA